MSQRLLRAAWRSYPRAGSRRDCLMALADRASEQGVAIASFGELERDTRFSRSTVVRAVRVLRAQGWLLRSRGEGRAKNGYRLDLRKLGVYQ